MIRKAFVGLILLILVSEGGAEPEKAIFSGVVRRLSTIYGVEPGALEVRIIRCPRVDEGFTGLVWNVEPGNGEKKLGHNTLWLVFRHEDGRIVKKLPVSVQVSGWFDVVVARKDIKSGSVLRKEDFEVRRVKFSRGTVDFFRAEDISHVAGNVARKFIRAGEVLRPYMIKKKPLLRRGERVKVKIVSRSVEIATYGKMKEDGYAGESVRVVCEPADRVFVGTVLDSLTVLVKLD